MILIFHIFQFDAAAAIAIVSIFSLIFSDYTSYAAFEPPFFTIELRRYAVGCRHFRLVAAIDARRAIADAAR